MAAGLDVCCRRLPLLRGDDFADARQCRGDPANTQQPRHLECMERLGKTIALNDSAAPALQELELCQGLHPLHDDLDLEFTCKAERCPYDCVVARLDADVFDEGLSDLDPVYRVAA